MYGKKSISESKEGSIVKALLANCRFGFVGGGLDDRGEFGDLYDNDQTQYSPGLTAVFAEQLTRQSIFDAIYNRNCYATTGERIIVGLFLAGLPMGTEIDTTAKPGLHVNRHITGYVSGTQNLKLVELIRNGKVLTKFTPNSHILDFEYDDMESLSDVALDANDKKAPFVFYYLRVLQEDGHMAWSSPIWVDCFPSKGITKFVKSKDKPVKKEVPMKKEAPAKKEVPVKKATPTKKEVPVKKAEPTKKIPANKKLPVTKKAKK